MTDKVRLLTQEREKLNRLVDEALQKGTPINETSEIRKQFRTVKRIAQEILQTETVLAQSRSVDRLMVMVEREEEKEG